MRAWVIVVTGMLFCGTTSLLGLALYAVRPFGPFNLPVSTDGIVEYAPLGLATGFLLAALSCSLAPRVTKAPGGWVLAFCAILALAVAAFWQFIGWGVYEVDTPSGITTVGASISDVFASSAIVLAFSWAVIAFAVCGVPTDTPRKLGKVPRNLHRPRLDP